jgi:hypothetical protein
VLLSVRNDSDAASLGFDTSLPNPARMYDYLIGGKDSFAADRAAADGLTAAAPHIPRMARENRPSATTTGRKYGG